ncbi:SdpI family protein [Nocardiopsis rhodophaea]|uniref:SdpI family protein n=1 Tax=Nocardiopsis rhodophaea TaxID=280238 RepID=UPI0031E12883
MTPFSVLRVIIEGILREGSRLEMEEFGALLCSALGLVAIAGLAHYIRNAAARGSLDRNSAIGLRTRITKSSDAAWVEGHRAAAPWLMSCAFTGYFIGLLTVGAAIIAVPTGFVGPALLALPAAGFAAAVVILVAATAIANRRGRGAVANRE